MFNKFKKVWYFHIANPVVWSGERGGFRVKIRRFWIETETLSGNFKARWTAAEYPYAYLLSAVSSGNEDTLWGYVERIYTWSMLLLHDQGLADDMDKAVKKYEKRMSAVKPEEDGEEAAIAEEKALQEFIELDPKEKKKRSKDIDKRFKETVKSIKADEA